MIRSQLTYRQSPVNKFLSTAARQACAAMIFALVCTHATAEEPAASAANTKILIKTNHGNIKAELYDQRAPITVKNFLEYLDAGHYNDTVFHRVIPRFMIQGGGFSPDMVEKETRDPIQNESKNRLRNERGTLAMARTSDPHSATAQFFINVRMNFSLNYRMGEFGYSVFGKVTEGLDVVDTISIQRTGRFMNDEAEYDDVPTQSVIIESISRIQ
ncbi:MAG: peptidylprolyl isomerase [Pseudomonadales bacterium]